MKKNILKTLTFGMSLTLLLGISACTNQTEKTAKNSEIIPPEKITIVASFYPLAEFSRQVGDDYVDVKNITPPGVEPHDYEPSPQDIAILQNADVFIFNGAGQDIWAEKAAKTLENKNIKIINMSEHFDLLKGEDGMQHIESENDENSGNDKNSEEHDEDHFEYDPHLWLDPTIAAKEVEYIRDVLIKKDPEHTEAYSKNTEKYLAELSALDKEFKNGVSSCKLKTFITSHRAFGYLAKQYGLQQIAIAGISPEEEPTARQLAELSKLAKENDIKVVFFETLVSPDLAKTLAEEIGAESMVLNPIEGLTKEEINDGANYVSIMKENLNNLKAALQCS